MRTAFAFGTGARLRRARGLFFSLCAWAACGATLADPPPPMPAEVDRRIWYRAVGLFEVGIALFEGCCLAALLKITMARAMATAIVANAASMIAGVLLPVVMQAIPAYAGYVPQVQQQFTIRMALTILVETPIAVLMNRDYPHRARLILTVIAINVVTCWVFNWWGQVMAMHYRW